MLVVVWDRISTAAEGRSTGARPQYSVLKPDHHPPYGVRYSVLLPSKSLAMLGIRIGVQALRFGPSSHSSFAKYGEHATVIRANTP